ncbi:MAG TPA: hemolysin family protein [Bdellovibrionota bacterium]|nr:hemolysin family protein [Bdellovibrionota bacterium]
MTFTLGLLIALVIPLLLIEGFFSGSEIALLSADKLALKRQAKHGSEGAKLALELASHPDRVLSTTLLMTNVCVISLSALIAVYFLGRGTRHSDLVAVLVTSPLVVLLGELVPKTIYRRYANTLAPWIARPVAWTFWVFYPATKILSAYTSYLARLAGPIEELMTGKRKSTRDELRSLLSYSRRESDLKTSEKRMIRRIFEFKDSEAKHALIPLVKVEAIAESATVREALERFESHRHSRMPVYSGRIDNIVGVIETSDLFSAVDLNHPIRNYISSAHYVAETQALEDLIIEMQREDTEMVVVVDEHGGAIGVLTFEDIVEEIVGEIDDEYDVESRPYKELSEGKWLVQAKMEIQAINESLKVELPEGDYETIAGFLLQQFGRIPEPRDELYFDTPAGSYKFTIREASQRQIDSVVIERTPSRKPPPTDH